MRKVSKLIKTVGRRPGGGKSYTLGSIAETIGMSAIPKAGRATAMDRVDAALGKRKAVGSVRVCGSQLDRGQQAKCPKCGREFLTDDKRPTCPNPKCKHTGSQKAFQIN